MRLPAEFLDDRQVSALSMSFSWLRKMNPTIRDTSPQSRAMSALAQALHRGLWRRSSGCRGRWTSGSSAPVRSVPGRDQRALVICHVAAASVADRLRDGGQQRRMSMLVATPGRGICRRNLTARLELHEHLSRQLRLVGGLVLCQHVPWNAPSVGDMQTLGAGPCTHLGLVVPGRAPGAA